MLAQHARNSGFDSQLIHKVDRLIHGSTEEEQKFEVTPGYIASLSVDGAMWNPV